MDGRRAVADAHRADQRRQARGVHPRLRRAGPVDARRADEPPARPGRDARHRARPVPHRRLARSWTSAPTCPTACPAPRSTSTAPSATSTGSPSAGRCSTCGRPTRTARTSRSSTSTRPGCARSTRPARTARYCVRTIAPLGYSIPMDGPVGELIGRTDDQPLPAGARPLPHQRARLRAADHAPVPGGRAVPGQRRGVRHEAGAGRRVHASASPARRPTAVSPRCRGPDGRVRLRAAAAGLIHAPVPSSLSAGQDRL